MCKVDRGEFFRSIERPRCEPVSVRSPRRRHAIDIVVIHRYRWDITGSRSQNHHVPLNKIESYLKYLLSTRGNLRQHLFWITKVADPRRPTNHKPIETLRLNVSTYLWFDEQQWTFSHSSPKYCIFQHPRMWKMIERVNGREPKTVELQIKPHHPLPQDFTSIEQVHWAICR